MGNAHGDASGKGVDGLEQSAPGAGAMQHDRAAAGCGQRQLVSEDSALVCGRNVAADAVKAAFAHGRGRVGKQVSVEPVNPIVSERRHIPGVDAKGGDDEGRCTGRWIAYQCGYGVPVVGRSGAAAETGHASVSRRPHGGITAAVETRVLHVGMGVKHGLSK